MRRAAEWTGVMYQCAQRFRNRSGEVMMTVTAALGSIGSLAGNYGPGRLQEDRDVEPQ